MKNVPIKEILMFSLIIIGIILSIFSIYLLAFVRRIPYWFPGHVGAVGIFMIYYAFFDERKNLIISSFLTASLILDILVIVMFSLFYSTLFSWYTIPDRTWMYTLIPIVLVALIISFVLQLFKNT